MVSEKAYAKVNLYLEVLGKREDGYHNIKSIFAKIALSDFIQIKKSEDNEIKIEIKNNVNACEIPLKDNLVYKSARLFLDKFNINCGLEILTEKNIPLGAGLGGGSSDCASTLIGLCKLFGIKKDDRVYDIALRLGSDVMFFLKETSISLCEGRGEVVTPITAIAPLPYILIVFPEINVSTKMVYSNMDYGYKMSDEQFIYALNAFGRSEKIDFSKILFNRLEKTTFEISQQVKDLKKKFIELDIPCLMSGSGSSVFGLSYDYDKIIYAYGILKKTFNFAYLTKFI